VVAFVSGDVVDRVGERGVRPATVLRELAQAVLRQEATARLDDGRWVLDFAFDVPDSIPATPRGFEKLALLLDRSGRGGASWVVQATDAGGEHEIEFDMGRPKMGVAA